LLKGRPVITKERCSAEAHDLAKDIAGGAGSGDDLSSAKLSYFSTAMQKVGGETPKDREATIQSRFEANNNGGSGYCTKDLQDLSIHENSGLCSGAPVVVAPTYEIGTCNTMERVTKVRDVTAPARGHEVSAWTAYSESGIVNDIPALEIWCKAECDKWVGCEATMDFSAGANRVYRAGGGSTGSYGICVISFSGADLAASQAKWDASPLNTGTCDQALRGGCWTFYPAVYPEGSCEKKM
jgi:hypothetical protein